MVHNFNLVVATIFIKMTQNMDAIDWQFDKKAKTKNYA